MAVMMAGALPLRMRLSSSQNPTSSRQCRRFSTLQCPRTAGANCLTSAAMELMNLHMAIADLAEHAVFHALCPAQRLRPAPGENKPLSVCSAVLSGDRSASVGEAEAGLRPLHEPWADTTSPAGHMVLTVFAGIAEFGRELIHERTRSGCVAAKAQGVRFGRPPKLTADQIALAQRLVGKGASVPEASKILNVHRATLYRALRS
jgi:Resolvase, N terminal domain/Helix-turn-helix domain of resolvase